MHLARGREFSTVRCCNASLPFGEQGPKLSMVSTGVIRHSARHAMKEVAMSTKRIGFALVLALILALAVWASVSVQHKAGRTAMDLGADTRPNPERPDMGDFPAPNPAVAQFGLKLKPAPVCGTKRSAGRVLPPLAFPSSPGAGTAPMPTACA
jgi:hypothetical protein